MPPTEAQRRATSEPRTAETPLGLTTGIVVLVIATLFMLSGIVLVMFGAAAAVILVVVGGILAFAGMKAVRHGRPSGTT